jgi:hypothetical protein
MIFTAMPKVSKKAANESSEIKPFEEVKPKVQPIVESVVPIEKTVHVSEPELGPFTTVAAARPLQPESSLVTPTIFPVEPAAEVLETSRAENSSGGGIKKAILFFVLGFVVGGGVVGGGIYYKLTMDKINSGSTGSAKEEVLPTAAPSITVTPTPSASASAQIKLSSYNVKVLNGSGISGKATQVKGLLEKAGFADIKVDNADKSNYTNTEVAIKLSVSSKVYDTVVSVLSKNYNVVKVEDPLDEKADFDVTITVGAPK